MFMADGYLDTAYSVVVLCNFLYSIKQLLLSYLHHVAC